MSQRAVAPHGGRPAWAGAVAAAILAMLMLPTMAAGLPGNTPSGSSALNVEAPDDASGAEDIRRLFSHLPGDVDPQEVLGPAAHWLLDDDGSIAPAPSGVDDVFAKVRRGVPWEPLPIPDIPDGEEPLLTALGEYAGVAGVELPDLSALRAQIATLRLQPEAEEALSQLVRAYNQALILEAEATKDLTPQELRAIDEGASRPDLLAKVDMADRLQAADLLVRTVEATKDAIALPPTPIVADIRPAPTDAQLDAAAQWLDAGESSWDRLHRLIGFGGLAVPAELPELPSLDLQSSLTLFALVLGRPLDEPVPLGDLDTLPPSLSQAIADIVTARAFGLLSGDPTLHGRLLLQAVEEAEPTLKAWAAVQDMQRAQLKAAGSVDVAMLLEGTLSSRPTGMFGGATGADLDGIAPPTDLTVLLQREGLTAAEAAEVAQSLPPQVALGAAHALEGIQDLEAAREGFLSGLTADERAAVTDGAARALGLMRAAHWSDDDAAFVESWARTMERMDADLAVLRNAQSDALAAVETAAAVLGAYAAAQPGGADGPVRDALDSASPEETVGGPSTQTTDPSPQRSWLQRAVDLVASFQIIGTASAQPSIVTGACRDHAFSDCDQDVWLQVTDIILITGFEGRTLGPTVASEAPVLLIDLGGDDTYPLPLGASDASTPVRVAIDVGGSDTYDAGGALAFGAAAGIGALGVLWDAAGDDTYRHSCEGAVCGAQGYGADGGTGVLVDGAGADTYEAPRSRAHGAGWSGDSFGGTGVLIDRDEGMDTLTADRGQGYGEGDRGIGILINDGDGDANTYITNTPNARYQGGHREGDQAVGILVDLGGRDTTYSNLHILPDDWTYQTYQDEGSGEDALRIRQDDALWMERDDGNGGLGLGLDTRLEDEDDDRYDNWVELLSGSDPDDEGSTPSQTATGSLLDTLLGLIPDPNDIDPDDLPGPEDIDPEDLDPQSLLGPLDPFVPPPVDVGLCAVAPDEENGGCDVAMNLLHVGPSSDDTITEPALILIELGGSDTYLTEVAGQGSFYDEGGQRFHGVGSIAIDLGGDDRYEDPGSPTQGAIELFIDGDIPDTSGSMDYAFSLTDTSGDGWCGDSSITTTGINRLQCRLLGEGDGEGVQSGVAWANRYADRATNPPEGALPIENQRLPPVSMLLEMGGNDTYTAGTRSQGSANSIGCDDDDTNSGDGQFAQLAGAAWLVDAAGSDTYAAGLHSQGSVSGLAGQAGLLDLGGDDHYTFATQARVGDSGNKPSIFVASGCNPPQDYLHTALLYDGGGRDTYHSSLVLVPEVSIDRDDPQSPVNDPVFASQGIADGGVFVAGVFIDDGAAFDTYLTRTDNGTQDVSAIKNYQTRLQQNDGGGGYFFDGATWFASSDDSDGDGDPEVLEFLAGTDRQGNGEHTGNLGRSDPESGESGLDDPGPWLRTKEHTETFTGVWVPGLAIGGHADTTYDEPVAFLVALGGDNQYTAPFVGGASSANSNSLDPSDFARRVALVLDAGTGNTTYRPDPDDCSHAVGAVDQLDVCPSLGGAINAVAILADGGGDNTFHTTGRVDVTDQGTASFDLVTQGAATDQGVGVLLSMDAASNLFLAELDVDVQRTPGQGPPMTVTGRGTAQGATTSGIGLLLSMGGSNDTYETHVTGSAGEGATLDRVALAQGAAATDSTNVLAQTIAYGLLLDEGGANRFMAPAGHAQGSGRVGPGTTAVGMLWSGPGDDTYEASDYSQGASSGFRASPGPEFTSTTAGAHPVGLLHDAGGHDTYRVRSSGAAAFSQGAGFLGSGVLMDLAGDDQYLAPGATHVQGAGVEGAGLLLDLGGNDWYEAAGEAQAYASDVWGIDAASLRAALTPQPDPDQVRPTNYTATLVNRYGNTVQVMPNPETYPAVVQDWVIGVVFNGQSPLGGQPFPNFLSLQLPFQVQTPSLGGGGDGDYLQAFTAAVQSDITRALDADRIVQGVQQVTIPQHRPTLGLLADVHGRDAYRVDGAGQGQARTLGTGSYQAFFLDGSGDDRYDAADAKHPLDPNNLGDGQPDGNGWVWTPRVPDAATQENITRLVEVMGETDHEVAEINLLLADATALVTDAGTVDMDKVDAWSQALMDLLDEAERRAGNASNRIQRDAMELATNITALPDDDDVQNRAAELADETNVRLRALADALQQEIAGTTGPAFGLGDDVAAELLNKTQAVSDRTDALAQRSAALAFYISTKPLGPAGGAFDAATRSLPRGIGMDVDEGLDAAIADLYDASTAVRIISLEIFSDEGEVQPSPEDPPTVSGALLARATVQMTQGDPQRVDRVAFSADNQPLGHGAYNAALSDPDEGILVYDSAWDTESATLPVAFPDGDYTLHASAYLASGPGGGTVGTPDLPAAESDPFPLVIDNPPVVSGAIHRVKNGLMDKDLLVAEGQSHLLLDLSVGPDVAWPADLDGDPGSEGADRRADLCTAWGVPTDCHPGANITLVRTNLTDPALPEKDFRELYLPHGDFQVPVTLAEAGGWPDGPYNLTVKARDVTDTPADPITFSGIIVDSGAPTSQITTPALANIQHRDAFGNLVLTWDQGDGVGSGVAASCLFQMDDEDVASDDWPHCFPAGTTSYSTPAATGQTMDFMVTAVDRAGNTDSPCTAWERNTAGLAPPECFGTKAARPGSVHSITVDFDAPIISSVGIDGLEPDEVTVRPGVTSVNFTAHVEDVSPPGADGPPSVEIRLPGRDPDCSAPADQCLILPDQFVREMETDGDGNYWYDEWHLHNQDLHAGRSREETVGFTVAAADQAGNPDAVVDAIHLDSLPPRVFSQDFPLVSQYTEVGDDGSVTTRAAAGPDMRLDVRARVLDHAMQGMDLDVSAIPGVEENLVGCDPDETSADDAMWLCRFVLPSSLDDGDYPVSFIATDAVGNTDDDEQLVIKVRAADLVFGNITIASRGHDHFHVEWTTDFPGTSEVEFGLNGQLGGGVLRPADQSAPDHLEHSVNVTGLAPSTDHYYRIVSVNEAGKRSNTTVFGPITTLNAYTFDLDGIHEDEAVRGNVRFGYDLTSKAGDAPVQAEIFIQDADNEEIVRFVEEVRLDIAPGELVLHTSDPPHKDYPVIADGDHRLIVELDRAGDEATVTSPRFHIDNSEPVIHLVSPRPHSTIADGSPTYEVIVEDPNGRAAPLTGTLTVEADGQWFQAPDLQILGDEPAGGSDMVRRVRFTLPTELDQGTQRLNLSVLDEAGNPGLADWTFVVDKVPPTRGDVTEVEYLPGPDAAKRGGDVRVAVALADDSRVASAHIDRSNLSSDADPVPLLQGDDGLWRATFTVPDDAPHGPVGLPLTAVDSQGNSGAVGTVNVTVDAYAPKTTDTSTFNVTYTSATIHVTTDEPTRALLGNATVPDAGEWRTQHALNATGLAPGKENALVVRTVDQAGNLVETPVTVTTQEDSQPPGPVGPLAVTSPAEGVVAMAWSPASDNAGIATYRIERLVDGVTNATFEWGGGNTTHRDGDAPAGIEVTYWVAALDVAGHVGPASEGTIRVLALPHLSDALVTPMRGPADEPFTFQVNYSHAGGVPADVVSVAVGGATHLLDRVDADGDDCRAACMYRVQVQLPARSLFDVPGGVTFKAILAGHTDTITLPEAPLSLRGGTTGGVQDITGTDAKNTPAVGVLPTILVMAIAAIIFFQRRRNLP